MAGLANWKKVAPPVSNPDTAHVYVGVDVADCKLYIKDDTGAVFKYETSANVAAAIAAALTNYDLSTVVDSKIADAINDLFNGAGSALDTLNELAAALGNDPNFATTVTNSIAAVQSDIDDHIADLLNPHSTTAAQVGAAPIAHVGAGGAEHANATTSVAGFMSAADKTKINAIVYKAGTIAGGSFAGNPKKATVTFSTAMPSTSYAINITGANTRTWTYETKTVNGFVINANANAALSGEVSWQAILNGEVG